MQRDIEIYQGSSSGFYFRSSANSPAEHHFDFTTRAGSIHRSIDDISTLQENQMPTSQLRTKTDRFNVTDERSRPLMRPSSGRPQLLWPQHGKLLELGVANSGKQNSCFSEQDSQHKCEAAAKHRIQGQNKHSVLIKFPRVAEDAWFQAFRQRLQLVWQKIKISGGKKSWWKIVPVCGGGISLNTLKHEEQQKVNAAPTGKLCVLQTMKDIWTVP